MNIFSLNEQNTLEQFEKKDKELDPRSKRSRRDLANAFVLLLQEKDFDSITIKDIVERAMVSRLTFYNQFKDKYELLEYIFKTSVEYMATNIDKDLERNPKDLSKEEIIKITIKNIVHVLYTNKDLVNKWIENDKSKAIYWCLTNFVKDVVFFIINENKQKFEMLFNHNAENIFVYFVAGGFTYSLYENEFKDVKSEEELTDEIFDFIIKKID